MTGRHSCDYYDGSAPSPAGQQTVCSARPRRWLRRSRADLGRFPCSLVDDSAEEAPDLTPATSPRPSRSTSPRPPGPRFEPLPEVPRPPTTGRWSTAGARRIRPRSARFRAGVSLRGVNAGFSRIPFFRHAHRTRTIWQCWHVPASSGPLATHPGTSRDRLPSAFAVLLRQNHGRGLPPPLHQQAPHGAPGSRPTGQVGDTDGSHPECSCGKRPPVTGTASTTTAPTTSAETSPSPSNTSPPSSPPDLR